MSETRQWPTLKEFQSRGEADLNQILTDVQLKWVKLGDKGKTEYYMSYDKCEHDHLRTGLGSEG